MGSTAEKLMKCNSLDDDFASDVKEFYILLFNCLVHFLPIYIYISQFFFFQCVQFPGILVIIACGFFPGRKQDGAETDLILEQCFMSLCSSVYFPWAKPSGEYLVEVAKKH